MSLYPNIQQDPWKYLLKLEKIRITCDLSISIVYIAQLCKQTTSNLPTKILNRINH